MTWVMIIDIHTWTISFLSTRGAAYIIVYYSFTYSSPPRRMTLYIHTRRGRPFFSSNHEDAPWYINQSQVSYIWHHVSRASLLVKRTWPKRFLSICILMNSMFLKSLSAGRSSGSLVRNCAKWMNSISMSVSSYILRIPAEIEKWRYQCKWNKKENNALLIEI